MPKLVPPVLPAGTLRERDQPVLPGLRPWRPADAGQVREAFGDAEIQRWHLLRIDDQDEARDWIAQWGRRWADEDAASWAIVDDGDEALGQVGLRGVDLAGASVHLSYWMLPQARGRGLATRAVGVVERWCFEEIGFRRLTLEHSTENVQSCRVAEKSGYALEGVLRSCWQHLDGWHDVHVHARTRAVDRPSSNTYGSNAGSVGAVPSS
ncbi:RimJ/RimL family protein N-acetyltransferase [Kribbella amoyensis]|uniref:RimJ/RimL family protein N-acetyltransferase n=1 Tax=Kribbella amoyensis TaxID=996641 RepID=A0A561BVA9_9ACTN|nr:GNAT family N-acetyltransferase [Kribbella amoyensis]TWD82844.1 RimJ/RimL family protein N-acetyltransferase [Kribbella amoyensis]